MRTALYVMAVLFVAALCLVAGANVLADVWLHLSWVPLADTILGFLAILVGLWLFGWGVWWARKLQ